MNKEEREQFLTWVKEDIARAVRDDLNSLMMPALSSSPFVTIADREDGIYVSPVEEDDREEYATIIPWEEFVDTVMSSDHDLIERYLPLFRDLVKQMEGRLP